ncbi:MAG: hypothetical protein ABIL09_25925 [Gemmatimonadota bacterium]
MSAAAALLAGAGVLIALLAAGCGAGRQDRGATPARIAFERGGGFSGLVQGCALADDGTAEGWEQRPGQPRQAQWRAAPAGEGVAELARGLVEAAGDWQSEGAGNMTTRLSVQLGEIERRWSWAGFEAPEGAPTAFAARLRDLQARCDAARRAGLDTRPQ